MQPAASLDGDELEVLDRVGEVHSPAVYARLFQRLVQQATRWPDERVSLPVFLIAGLLAYQHQLRRSGTFSEDRLGRVHPEITPPAASGGFPEPGEGGPRWNEVPSGAG